MSSREKEKNKTRINVQAYIDPRKLARIDIHLYENGLAARGYSELIRSIINVVDASLPELSLSSEQAREWFGKRGFPVEQFIEHDKSTKPILPLIDISTKSLSSVDEVDDEVNRRLEKLIAGQRGL